MTLQMNSMALISNGYKLVAEYKVWKRYETVGGWMSPVTYTCYQKGHDCIIKIISKRSSFTKCFDSKEKANTFITNKLTNCDKYEKTR